MVQYSLYKYILFSSGICNDCMVFLYGNEHSIWVANSQREKC